MKEVFFIRANSARTLAQQAIALYPNAEKELALPLHRLTNDTRLMPMGYVARMYETIERLSHDPLCMIHLGQSLTLDVLGPFSHLVRSSYSLSMAIERINLTMNAVFSGVQVNLTRTGPIAKWSASSVVMEPRARLQDSIVTATLLLGLLRLFLGRDYRPIKVMLCGTCPSTPGSFERRLNSSIEWHSPDTQIWFSFSDMARTRVPDPRDLSLKSMTVEQAMHCMLMPRPDDLVKTIYELVRFSMYFGHPSLEFVAAEFEISPQALQRRLQHKGLSFSDIAHLAVCNEAILLMREGMDLDQVAIEVGFTSTSAFSRSFKRLNGMTPRKYRLEILRLA